MNKECANCIKRKTMLCPNSSECYSTKDKPYYRETDSDYEIELIGENEKLQHQLEVSEQKRLKAIEYIKETCVDNGMYDGIPDYMFDKTNANKLLEILGGSDNFIIVSDVLKGGYN